MAARRRLPEDRPDVRDVSVERGMGIGELSRRTGVTARALRLYDRHGLLLPARTEGGRRLYGETDVLRLAQVLALKQLGCSLGTIGTLMAQRELDAAALLRLWSDRINAERHQLDAAAHRIAAAQDQIVAGATLSFDALCELLRDGESRTDAAYQGVIDHWFSAGEQARWRAARDNVTDNSRGFAAWKALASRVHSAIADGVSPQSLAGVTLGREWMEELQTMADAVGSEMYVKAVEAFTTDPPFGAERMLPARHREIIAWVSAAVDAGRR